MYIPQHFYIDTKIHGRSSRIHRYPSIHLFSVIPCSYFISSLVL